MMHNYIFLLSITIIGILVPSTLFAQGLALSVTPTLFEMSASPLQAWNSSIKVLNTNPQPLTVYATVVNFQPKGETGQGTFVPVFEERTEGKTLAEWITISDQPFVISKEGSVEIPIQVNVPEDASPGGHYAAIMIGTRPMNSDDPFQVRTAQVVTSLFFVRIAGDVIEQGNVRNFRTTHSFVQKPLVDFEVRFENKGNVHLQPQGEIVITNMWGKERGVVPINQLTNFGNVLPNSIRKFEFTWHGEQTFTDIGRYTAQLTLGFGVEGKQFVTRSIHFWIVPLKPVVFTLLVIVLLLWFVTWSIKSYVRKMLAMSTQYGYVPMSQKHAHNNDIIVGKTSVLVQPVREGFVDLKQIMSHAHVTLSTLKTLLQFLLKYKKFFFALITFVGIAIVLSLYIKEVTTSQRDYEITIDKQDTDMTLSSEDIIYKKTEKKIDQPVLVNPKETQSFVLTLINSSDTPGMAASLQHELESKGYTVDSLESDFSTPKERTVVVYDLAVQEEAVALSKLLNGALLSSRPKSDTDTISKISVFIGNDYNSQ